ncbi:MAG: DUF4861 domain-containing protein [Bacteroidales bacterium]
MNYKLLLLSLCGISSFTANAQFRLPQLKQKVRIEVTNPSKEARADEPVSICFPEGKYRSVTVWDGKQEIASQMDDLDCSGMPEELAFVVNLKGKEKKVLTLIFTEQATPERYKPRVHAQMFFRDKQNNAIIPTDTASSPTGNLYSSLHHHGPAFESELMAYRLYFDQKQTVDLYGKYKKQLELAESLWYPTDEQLAKGFGDDILRVSGSVGIGTLKGWAGNKAVHIAPVSNREAHILAKGPVRTVVDMNVTGWEYQGETVDVKSRFILFAGQRECEVIQQFTTPAAKKLTFATGVQRIKGSEHLSDGKGMTAVWGTNWPVNDTIKYAKQTLGLAVEIPEHYLVKEVEDKANYLYEIRPDENGQIRYRMTVCAEKENFGVKSAPAFFDYVNGWKEKQPVRIRLK